MFLFPDLSNVFSCFCSSSNVHVGQFFYTLLWCWSYFSWKNKKPKQFLEISSCTPPHPPLYSDCVQKYEHPCIIHRPGWVSFETTLTPLSRGVYLKLCFYEWTVTPLEPHAQNRPSLLQVVLAMVFFHSSRKVTNLDCLLAWLHLLPEDFTGRCPAFLTLLSSFTYWPFMSFNHCSHCLSSLAFFCSLHVSLHNFITLVFYMPTKSAPHEQ